MLESEFWVHIPLSLGKRAILGDLLNLSLHPLTTLKGLTVSVNLLKQSWTSISAISTRCLLLSCLWLDEWTLPPKVPIRSHKTKSACHTQNHSWLSWHKPV